MLIEIESQEDPARVYSGFPSLDRYIDGFQLGELIIISGPTKHGKTLLAQTLTYEFSRQNFFPVWFSFELPPRQFLRSFPDLPLFYMPERLVPNAVGWVVKKVNESFKEYHTRVVFIDHLHFLFDIALKNNPSLQIGTVIRELKTLAVRGEYIIFLLCHTKKGSLEKRMTYEAIRDSSFVAQESDCVLMIKRDITNPESNEAILTVEFHRRTGVMNKKVKLKKINGLLMEIENETV